MILHYLERCFLIIVYQVRCGLTYEYSETKQTLKINFWLARGLDSLRIWLYMLHAVDVGIPQRTFYVHTLGTASQVHCWLINICCFVMFYWNKLIRFLSSTPYPPPSFPCLVLWFLVIPTSPPTPIFRAINISLEKKWDFRILLWITWIKSHKFLYIYWDLSHS